VSQENRRSEVFKKLLPQPVQEKKEAYKKVRAAK